MHYYNLDNTGTQRNALWKLSRTRECFTWSFIKPRCKEETPSPRELHTEWEYEEKLWTFGGEGPSPEGYLHDHGDIAYIYNNQLLCYDPNSNKWTNTPCFGDVPSPRSGHACAIIKNKVWLFGGFPQRSGLVDDMYELTLPSLTWAQIQTGEPRPETRDLCSLTPLRDNCLVLHGGSGESQTLSDTWIVDLTSHSWRLYTSRNDHARMFHTGWSGFSNDAIIFGGSKGCMYDNTGEVFNSIFHVMLEPKCLQQLAMQIIYKHQDALPWKLLPSKLISLLGL